MTGENTIALEKPSLPLATRESLRLRRWGEGGPGRARSEWELATEAALLLAMSDSVRTSRELALALLDQCPSQSVQIVDLSGFRLNAEILNNAVTELDPRASLAYSVKANPRPEILELLWSEGVRFFDCASLGEVSLLRQFLPCPELIYNYDNKERYAIESALRAGVRRFAAQDSEELELLLGALHRVRVSPQEVEVGIRLCPDNHGAEIPFNERFGAPPELASALFARLEREGLIRGLYVHPGSQVLNEEVLAASAERACDFARSIGRVRTLNLGGGVPVGQGVVSADQSVAAIGRGLSRGRLDNALETHDGARVIVELGRALAAPALTLLVPILKVDGPRRRIFLASGLFDTFSDHVIHDVDFQFEALSADGCELGSACSEWTVFGPTCDPGDRFRRPLRLPPDLKSGDALVLPASGAYLDAQGGGFRSGPWQRRPSGFNGRSGPLYVAFDAPTEDAPNGTESSYWPRAVEDGSVARQSLTGAASAEFQIENLEGNRIGDNVVREVTELFLEAFCSDWNEWAFCPTCDPVRDSARPGVSRVSAAAVYGFGPNETVPIEQLLGDPRVPLCEHCHQSMLLFHHPWATYEKLRGILRGDAWVTLVRRRGSAACSGGTQGEVVGLSFAYRTTLRKAFESEWRLKYPYSLWTEKERHTRSWLEFRHRVSRVVQEKLPEFRPQRSALLSPNTPILLYNCFVLRRGSGRGRGLLRQMCRELHWNLMPRETHQLLSVGETRFGTLPHQILTAAGFTSVHGVLESPEKCLEKGDYVLGVNSFERYARGLAGPQAETLDLVRGQER